jgi:orotate phosphoribosyltransferase
MSASDLLILAKGCGAIKEGHFLLRSGLHSGVYVEKFHLLERPDVLSLFAESLCSKLFGPFDRVVGPSLGGMLVAYEVARHLGLPASYAEKGEGEEMVLRRGKGVSANEKILVVDDVMTTGGSVLKTVAAVKSRGGIVAQIGVLVDRAAELPAELTYVSALRYVLPVYEQSSCPLCSRGLPLVKLGG